jgi:hypothetical protein
MLARPTKIASLELLGLIWARPHHRQLNEEHSDGEKRGDDGSADRSMPRLTGDVPEQMTPTTGGAPAHLIGRAGGNIDDLGDPDAVNAAHGVVGVCAVGSAPPRTQPNAHVAGFGVTVSVPPPSRTPMQPMVDAESARDHQPAAGYTRSDRAAICLLPRSGFEPVHRQGEPPVNPRRTAWIDRDSDHHVRSVSARTPRNSPTASGIARHQNRLNHGLTGTNQHPASLTGTGRYGFEATSKPMGPRISGRRVRFPYASAPATIQFSSDMPDGDFAVICVPWQLHVSSRDETGDDHGPQPGVMGAIFERSPPAHGNAVPAGGSPQAAMSNDDGDVPRRR